MDIRHVWNLFAVLALLVVLLGRSVGAQRGRASGVPAAPAAAGATVALEQQLKRTVTWNPAQVQRVADLTRSIREEAGVPLYVDAALEGKDIYLTRGKASADALAALVAMELRLHRRRVGSTLFLARTARPLSTMRPQELREMALSVRPDLAERYLSLRRDVQQSLTLRKFSDRIPIPEDWFAEDTTLAFSSLPNRTQVWLTRVMHTHPYRTADHERAELSTSKVRFRHTLSIDGAYDAEKHQGTFFSFQVD